MTFVKSKSKFDSSQCSLEKEGQRCPNTWKKDEEYIYDTDAKKAYCLKHDDINSKVVKSSGGGYGRGASIPLVRDVDDGLKACGAFTITVIPAIKTCMDAFPDIDKTKIFESYLAIFIGKHPMGVK